MAPPTTLARKNNKYVSIIHASILLLMLMRMLVSAVAGIVDAGSKRPTGIPDPGYKKRKRREDLPPGADLT